MDLVNVRSIDGEPLSHCVICEQIKDWCRELLDLLLQRYLNDYNNDNIVATKPFDFVTHHR